jgi:hypothetical protein
MQPLIGSELSRARERELLERARRERAVRRPSTRRPPQGPDPA